MKQNGTVAAYQIIQIPPHPSWSHPAKKGSGTILWQREKGKCEEDEVRKDVQRKREERRQKLSNGIFTASVNQRFIDRCRAWWHKKEKFIPKYCIRG